MEINELLFIDEKGLKKEKEKLIKITYDLNKFLKAAEVILGSLDPDQKQELKKRKLEYVREQLRNKFQFPNASEEFNLQSLGVDLTEVNQLSKARWSGYQFEVDEDGVFQSIEHQSAFDRYFYYADTKAKQTALSFAKQFEALFLVAQEKGFINPVHLGSVSHALKGLLTIDGIPGREDCKLVVNREGIALKA